MMANLLSVKDVTCTENPQEFNPNDSAFDKVVDPCTEFQLQCNTGVKSPNEAFNLPKHSSRKHSLISLRGKVNYKVDDNELPRVHRTSSTQSVTNMLRKENFRRHYSESSDFNGSDRTILSSLSNCNDNISVKSISSQLNMSLNSDDSLILPNYMDRLETASNISLTSNLTDIPRSNISSVSDLTGYEEEFFQIKKLLIHGSTQSVFRPDISSDKNKIDVSFYEHKIEELEAQLQETLAENERYKFDLKDLETKLQLIWQEKFQEVMRQKAQCEGQLENVRKQYKITLNEKEKILLNFKQDGFDGKKSLRDEFTKLQQKLNSLEKSNSDLNSKLFLSSNESRQWQSEFLKTEAENEKLRINLQEIKSELDSKNSVLFGLKNKITEQHIEIQNHVQAKLKINNHITTLNNDIEAIKKSEKWYVDQLHGCQLVKSNIQQEFMSTQSNLISSNQKIENMKMEVSHWQNMYEEAQRKAMREKEKLLRKVEMIEADILEREAILKCTQTENDTKIELNYVTKQIDESNDYKMIIQDYEEQVINMKKIISDQNSSIGSQQKLNTDYLVRLTTLQKKMNESEINTQTLENRNKDLEMKCNNYSENIRTKENELLELRNKIVNMEVALHAANREKSEIDEVVKNVRDDFNKFMKCYQSMKEKLEEKTKIITQFEHEKQELFMENNWKVCEIEKLQNKILEVKGLQAEIMEVKNLYNDLLMEKDTICEENNALIVQNQGLQTECNNFKQKISECEKKLSELKDTETKIMEFKNISNQLLIEKNMVCQEYNSLKLSKQELEYDCNHLKQKITELESQLLELKQQDKKSNEENVFKLTKDITNLENEILKLNKMLEIREDQLLNQTKSCEFLNNEIIDKDETIKELREKLLYTQDRDGISEAEYMNIHLQSKVNDLTKKLTDANSVIEQFNNLCRNSETEKHNLAIQLGQLKKELENSKVQAELSKDSNKFIDSDTQTDFTVEPLAINLESIRIKLLELISDNNNMSNQQLNSSATIYNADTLNTINEYLNKVLNLKESQIKQLETSEKTNRILRGKLLKLKNKLKTKLRNLNDKCAKLDNNYEKMHKIVEVISEYYSNKKSNTVSVGNQTNLEFKIDQASNLVQEIKELKTLLRVNEVEKKEQYKRFEKNNHTLLRKVKEHMRGRKTIEKQFSSLQETYNCALTEINNLKLFNNRLEIELTTFKSRCNEYKIISDKLNNDIIQLEKEKNKINTNNVASECLNYLDKEKFSRELKEFEYKYKNLEDKITWHEKEISDKDQGITECKKQLFNEKLQCSALKKQISSIQMCLDNANEQLDNKQVEFGHLKSVVEKLETNEKLLTDQLENAHLQYQECKRKLETALRSLDEKTAKDDILGDEIKTLSCHLHQKTLELNNLENKYALLESQISSKETVHQKTVDEFQTSLAELQTEIDQIRNDKFFLQRLCADLKMSLQGTLNQNKVLKLRLEALENEAKDLTENLKFASLPNLPSPSKIDEDYINRLLQQSTVLPDKPLRNLRSCLDSLKQEMATLQREIIAKTQSDISL